jgi:acyl-CoA thioesterase-2
MLKGLKLEVLGPGRYEAPHVDGLGNGFLVFGGQLLAQMVIAAGTELVGKPLTSLHAVFARPGRLEAPLYIDVEVLQAGRNAGSARVTVHQGAPLCVQALVLAMAPQPEIGRHSDRAPEVGRPEDATLLEVRLADVEARVVDGVDLGDLRGGNPPELHVWMRVPDAPPGPLVAQAMLAYCSEMFFVATALRPHEGVSQAKAYSTFAPAVVSHAVAFHDGSFDASDWLLFAFSSPHTAAGRVFGRADVFSEAGVLLASVWQENLLRPVAS